MLWILYSLLSAFFFGIKDILAKKEFGKDIKPLEIIFEEYFLLLILMGVFFFYKIDFTSYIFMWHLYLIKALIILCSTGVYFYLLRKHEISLVSPLLNISPIFLLVFTNLFLFEIITIYQFLGIFLILISTYYLEVIIHNHDKDNPHEHHYNLVNGLKSSFFLLTIIMLITISLRAIFDKVILEKVNVYTDMFFISIIITTILFIYYLYEKNLPKILKNGKNEPDLFIIAVFSILSNFFILLAIAIPTALVSLIVPLKRTSTLFSSLVGGYLFHEKHLFQKIVSIILMLIGILLIISKDLVQIMINL